MILDEKNCWNFAWIVVDNVVWALDVFFQAYLKELGLINIAIAHGFQNNLSSWFMMFLLMFFFSWKLKLKGIFGGSSLKLFHFKSLNTTIIKSFFNFSLKNNLDKIYNDYPHKIASPLNLKQPQKTKTKLWKVRWDGLFGVPPPKTKLLLVKS
jgi:hypothetical protein